jgi:hypothetical protein
MWPYILVTTVPLVEGEYTPLVCSYRQSWLDQTSHGTFAVPTLLPYRTFPSTYPHTFWPSVRNTVLNLIRPSHGTIPYRTVRYRYRTVTVPYRTVSCYHIVPYRSNAYGQRKYMSPARIDLASQPLNTADSQKYPYRKSVGQKCWNGRLQHFWPKVLESAIPTLFSQHFLAICWAKVPCEGRIRRISVRFVRVRIHNSTEKCHVKFGLMDFFIYKWTHPCSGRGGRGWTVYQGT